MNTAAMTLMEATWPPKIRETHEAYVLRQAEGGGGRVNSASLLPPAATPLQIEEAEARMRAWGLEPSFLITEDWQAELLSDWKQGEHVLIYAGPCPQEAAGPYTAAWPANAAQEALWEQAGTGAARRAVMGQVAVPKAALSLDIAGQTAGVLFAAVTQGHVVLQAVEVAPQLRRRGIGRALLAAAAQWGRAQGASRMMLVVTAQNTPALALYEAMGLRQIGAYHYRLKA